MTNKHYFIQQRNDGHYAAMAKGAQKASGLFDTQKEAIEFVRVMNPNDRPDVERVKTTSMGRAHRWRSAEA